MTIARDVAALIFRKTLGRKALCVSALAAGAVWLASPAEARVPAFNAACPGRITVQAERGDVFINGQPARVKRINEGYYEARAGGVAISIATAPDGRTSVAYKMRGAGGVCMVRGERMPPPGDGFGGRPNDRPNDRPGDRPGDRPDDRLPPPMQDGFDAGPGRNGPAGQMAATCRAAAAAQFRVRPSDVRTGRPDRDGRRLVIQGSFRDRGGREAVFACHFDGNGQLISVR